jgi:hypothetical protein
MTFSKKTRKRRIQRKKRRSITRKMKGGGFFESKWQSIENIYYHDQIPRYLPNLPKGHESYDLLQRIIAKYGIKSHCNQKDRFWETSLFPDKLKREKKFYSRGYSTSSASLGDRGEIVHSGTNSAGSSQIETRSYTFKLFPKLVNLGQTCSDVSSYYDQNGDFTNDNPPEWQLSEKNFYSGEALHENDKLSNNYLKHYLQEKVWCKAEFPPQKGWKCTSTPITSVELREQICGKNAFDYKTEDIKTFTLDFPSDKEPYESNKITYYLNQEPQFEVNCIRYAPGYINIEVVDLTTEQSIAITKRALR